MSKINPHFKPQDSFKSKWITDGIDRAGIDYLENLGFYLCDKKTEKDQYPGHSAVTVSQIRNIFGEIKRLASLGNLSDKAASMDFMLLRPKIAYNAARVMAKNKNSRIVAFKEVLEKAHDAVDLQQAEHLQNFAKFAEAIVAYHKVYGGKE
jgi:CRISPR type III-A-associated protein Csm2